MVSRAKGRKRRERDEGTAEVISSAVERADKRPVIVEVKGSKLRGTGGLKSATAANPLKVRAALYGRDRVKGKDAKKLKPAKTGRLSLVDAVYAPVDRLRARAMTAAMHDPEVPSGKLPPRP